MKKLWLNPTTNIWKTLKVSHGWKWYLYLNWSVKIYFFVEKL